jgi:Neurotransmitter-gated ion-channel transmembrane region
LFGLSAGENLISPEFSRFRSGPASLDNDIVAGGIEIRRDRVSSPPAPDRDEGSPVYPGLARRSTLDQDQHNRSRHIRGGTYARCDVELELTRDWIYHAWKLGVPLMLIAFMAYGVYFIPASAVPQQIGLGMMSMLTRIAYMLTLGNTLPRISYLTRADRFFVGSAVLVFLGLLKAVITLMVAQTPRAHIVERVDRWGRWIYPFGMLVNFAIAFLI